MFKTQKKGKNNDQSHHKKTKKTPHKKPIIRKKTVYLYLPYNTEKADSIMKHFPPSELIINEDGSIFHLHITPKQLAEKIILVGDPGRVALVSSFFDEIECNVSNREFNTVTGSYQGKRITVISTGIGTDNIDIVLNELDALANINLQTRTENRSFRQLTLVRVGTSGGMQPDIPLGSFLASEKSVGFDGVLNFYAGRDEVCDLDFEASLKKQLQWNKDFCNPYVIHSDAELVNQIAKNDMLRGVTISANGFYGPQGRELRLPLAEPLLNERIENFRYQTDRLTNYEMESSAIAGLARLMGHRAMTVCVIIANRRVEAANTDYKPFVKTLIEIVLKRI